MILFCFKQEEKSRLMAMPVLWAGLSQFLRFVKIYIVYRNENQGLYTFITYKLIIISRFNVAVLLIKGDLSNWVISPSHGELPLQTMAPSDSWPASPMVTSTILSRANSSPSTTSRCPSEDVGDRCHASGPAPPPPPATRRCRTRWSSPSSPGMRNMS